MSSIFSSILTGSFSVGQYLLCLLFAGLCGAIAALTLGRESTSSRSFLISLVVLPIIVALSFSAPSVASLQPIAHPISSSVCSRCSAPLGSVQ